MVCLYALLIFRPFICPMLSSRCWHLNQYHQELLNTPCWNGVTLVWIIFVTFIFNYCRVIDSPTFYIAKFQVTTTSSSFFVSTPPSPHFLDFVLPFKWFDKKVRGMFQCLLTYFNELSHFQLYPCIFPKLHQSIYLSQ